MTTRTKPRNLHIIGVDPSLAATGLSMDRQNSLTVKSKHAEGDARLTYLYALTKASGFGADLAVIEDLPKNAMGAGLTGMSQGAVRMALQDLNIPYVFITPSTLKKAATGSGKATKPDMAKALQVFVDNGDVEINLKDDNQVDAFWLREVGITLMGYSSLLTDPSAVDRYVDTPPIREVHARLGR